MALKGKLGILTGNLKIVCKFVLNLCPFARFDVRLRIPLDERAINDGFNSSTQRVKTYGINKFRGKRTFLLKTERPAAGLWKDSDPVTK